MPKCDWYHMIRLFANKLQNLPMLFTIGLAIRIVCVWHASTHDIENCVKWGQNTLNVSLGDAFENVYHPFQYHIFSLAAFIAELVGATTERMIRFENLFFDVGIFLLFVGLCRRLGVATWLAGVYWLSPFTICLFTLGYVDFQMGFFIVMFLYALAAVDEKIAMDYLIAGIPLGLAFVMKPQTQIIVVAIAVYLGLCLFFRRHWRPCLVMIGPLIFFSLYQAYFIGFKHDFMYLPNIYLYAGSKMPSFSANMPNIWQLVAIFYQTSDAPLYSIRDDMLTLGGLTFRHIATIVTLSTLTYSVVRTFRSTRSGSEAKGLIFAAAISSILLPFLMTAAHENHFYYGSLVAPLVLYTSRSRIGWLAFAGVITIVFVNIAWIYLPESRLFLTPPGIPSRAVMALLGTIFSLVMIARVIVDLPKTVVTTLELSSRRISPRA